MKCEFTAGNGHLELLEWAREHQCDEKILYKSEEYGHLELLEWARINGRPSEAEDERSIYNSNEKTWWYPESKLCQLHENK